MSGSVSLINGHIDPDKKPMTFEDVKRIRENPTAEDVDSAELHRLIDIALEKQIPKKPSETDAYPHRLYCPNCYFTFCFNKENLDAIKQMQMYNYCPDCGQALDWSDTE